VRERASFDQVCCRNAPIAAIVIARIPSEEFTIERAQRPAEKRGPWVKALSGEGFFRLDFLVLFHQGKRTSLSGNERHQATSYTRDQR